MLYKSTTLIYSELILALALERYHRTYNVPTETLCAIRRLSLFNTSLSDTPSPSVVATCRDVYTPEHTCVDVFIVSSFCTSTQSCTLFGQVVE